MKVTHFNEIPLENVDIEGVKDTKIRWLISQKDNAPNFALRMFELEPGGFTPLHTHDWEHEVFVIQGSGTLVLKNETIPFQQWDVIYIDPNFEHRFRNDGDTLLRFLCAIPHKKAQKVSQNPLGDSPVNNC
ncbi:MAG: cupin domain-containing protein [Candidatus Cloacimonadota bacterium]|nr:cupin domain-containing protein [Candidatus Cloacimonadota bacterium]